MSSSSKIQIGVGLNNSDFDKGIANLKKSLGGLGEHGIEIAKIAGGFALAEIGAKSFEMALETCKEYITGLGEAAAQMALAAGQVGLNTDEYQVWGKALHMVGGDAEQLGKAVQSMTDVIAEAGRGSEEAQSKLGRLGLAWETLKDKSVSERMEEVVRALGAIGDASGRIEAAGSVFGTKTGRSFAAMAPDFDAIKDKAEETGIVFKDSFVESAHAFEESMTEILTNLKAASAEMLGPLLEELASVTKAIAEVSGGQAKKTVDKNNGTSNMTGGMWEEYAGLLSGKGWLWQDDQTVYFPAPTQEEIQALKTHTEEMKKNKEERERLRQEEANKKDAAKEKKATDTYDEGITTLDHQIELQKLLLDGKREEAELQKQIWELQQKMGRGLTDEEKTKLAGKKDELEELKREQESKDQDAKAHSFASESVDRIKDETEVQKLKDQGRSEDAEFLKLQQSYREKFGSTMSDDELGNLKNALDGKYSEQDTKSADQWNKKIEGETPNADQLSRIGLGIGNDGALDIQREGLSVQKQMLQGIIKLGDNANLGGGYTLSA